MIEAGFTVILQSNVGFFASKDEASRHEHVAQFCRKYKCGFHETFHKPLQTNGPQVQTQALFISFGIRGGLHGASSRVANFYFEVFNFPFLNICHSLLNCTVCIMYKDIVCTATIDHFWT